MKICVISQVYYRSAIDAAYAADPALAGRSFAEQEQAIRRLHLVRSDAYARALARLGHETRQIFSDIPPLLAAWRREAGDAPAPADAQADALAGVLGQVRAFGAEVVIIQGLGGFTPVWPSALRAEVPSLRILVGIEGNRIKPPTLPEIDLLFVNIPALIEPARAAGKAPVLLYHAFDPSILPLLPAPERGHGFVFSGSSGYGMMRTHDDRFTFLRRLFAETDLEGWMFEPRDDHNGPFRAPLGREFADRCHGAVWGLEMLSLLSQAEITLNIHGTVPDRNVGNMRLFEATGVGSCLLTDDGVNLAELFEPGRECLAYRSADEAIALRADLARRPAWRQAIAAAGQARTLADHTVDRRAAEIDRHLRRHG